MLLTHTDNSPSESHLLLVCSALALLLTLSLLRGLTVFLRTGNPCDSIFIVGATIALGVCWQSLPLIVDETFNQVIVPPFNHAAAASSVSSASVPSVSSASVSVCLHQSLPSITDYYWSSCKYIVMVSSWYKSKIKSRSCRCTKTCGRKYCIDSVYNYDEESIPCASDEQWEYYVRCIDSSWIYSTMETFRYFWRDESFFTCFVSMW